MLRLLIFIAGFVAGSILPFSLFADEPFEIEFTPAFTNSDSQLIREISTSARINDLVELVNELFVLEEKLTVIFGAEDGPLYDPQLSQIWMPASFVTEIRERFGNAMEFENPEEVKEVVVDVLQHTLLHELGHALVSQFDLPILGREEDAVDALGSVLLIEYMQDGQSIALSAADMFALESEDRVTLEEADFWDEHSFDLQRYYATLCHVYGSDTDAFEELLEEDGLGEERAEQCEYEYTKLVEDWLGVLEPYMDEL